MKKYEVFILHDALDNELRRDLGSSKYGYFLAKNFRTLSAEKKLIKYTPEYLKFEKERIDLCEKYSTNLDEKTLLYQFTAENRAKFDEDLKKLAEKHKKAIDDQTSFLDSDCEINFYKIKPDGIPDDVSTKMISLFLKFGMINEEND